MYTIIATRDGRTVRIGAPFPAEDIPFMFKLMDVPVRTNLGTFYPDELSIKEVAA